MSPDLIPEGDKEYAFFAYSPKSAVSNLALSKINVPAAQAPLTCNSVDEAAHILLGTSEVVTEKPEAVEMSFDHLLAYGKITLTNIPDDVTITSIAMETDSQITGEFTHNPADGSLTGTTPLAAYKKVVIETNNLTGVNSQMAFWFAIAPVDLEGQDVTFTVYTTSGKYVKPVTFPKGKGNFQAGQVAAFSLNFSGIEKHAVYNLANPSDITIGSLVIIAGTDSYNNFVAMGTDRRPKYNTNRFGVPVERNEGGAIEEPADTIQIFELVPGLMDETVMFKCVNGQFAGMYISTSFNLSSGSGNTTLKSVSSSSSEYASGLTSFSFQWGADDSYSSMPRYIRIKSNGPTSGESTTMCAYSYLSPWGDANGTDKAFFYCKNKDNARKFIGVYKLEGTGHGKNIYHR